MGYLDLLKEIPQCNLRASSKLKYNLALKKFQFLESSVEESDNPGEVFNEIEIEWRKLGSDLSHLLQLIGDYTQEEALHGFSCHKDVIHGK